MEIYKRTLMKAVTWELSGIIVLSILNYIVFGQAWSSAWVALGYGVLRVGMYYGHERLWKHICWGKQKKG